MGPCQRAPPSDSDVPRENMIKLYLSGPVFVNQSFTGYRRYFHLFERVEQPVWRSIDGFLLFSPNGIC